MMFDPGFDINIDAQKMQFKYGDECFGPEAERRNLNSIRKSLLDPNCDGPETVYVIAMDVGKKEHKEELISQHLLYGTVTYAAGKLGKEPIRSQGHIHKNSEYANGWSTPEVYEIWQGRAIILMQEFAEDDPGRCFAVTAEPGDVVIVPPFWAHATISADPTQALTFGAWCDRDYGFEYEGVRKHKGLAWYPLLKNDRIDWKFNENYKKVELIEKAPDVYKDFNLNPCIPIYKQWEYDRKKFNFVTRPDLFADYWKGFVP